MRSTSSAIAHTPKSATSPSRGTAPRTSTWSMMPHRGAPL